MGLYADHKAEALPVGITATGVIPSPISSGSVGVESSGIGFVSGSVCDCGAGLVKIFIIVLSNDSVAEVSITGLS